MQTQLQTLVDTAQIVTTSAGSGTDVAEHSPAPSFTIEFDPDEESRRRYRFEPKHDTTGWWRYEDEWTGTEWQRLVCESIKTVSLSIDGIPVFDK